MFGDFQSLKSNPDEHRIQPIEPSQLAMDVSFKRYTFKQDLDLQSTSPLDANALITAAQQGEEANEAEGWVRNINTAAAL